MTTVTNISDRAMLVDLTIRSWTASKNDKKVSREVAQAHNSDVSMGNYSKRLVAKEAKEILDRIGREATAVYWRYTLPWQDRGARILSSSAYFKFREEMRALESEWEQAVDVFCNEYPHYVEDARQRLNSLFEAGDYPAPERIRRTFALSYNVFPVPMAGDFRVELGASEIANIKTDIEAQTQEILKDAIASLAGRIREVVGHMAARLRAYTGTRDGTFRDSLVSNVRELAELIPSLNITDDPRISTMVEDMKILYSSTPEMLRESEIIREQIAEKAEAILAKVKEFAA